MRTEEELFAAWKGAPGNYISTALRAVYDLGRADAEKEAADALAAEKAAHDKTLDCLLRLRAEWLTVTDAAGMQSTSEARDIASAIVGSRRNLAAATDRIARTVLYARDRLAEPWAREVLAALGQPVAEREGAGGRAAFIAAGHSVMCAEFGSATDCPACLETNPPAESPAAAPTLTPDDVRKLAREVVAEAAERATAWAPFAGLAQALRRGTP